MLHFAGRSRVWDVMGLRFKSLSKTESNEIQSTGQWASKIERKFFQVFSALLHTVLQHDVCDKQDFFFNGLTSSDWESDKNVQTETLVLLRRSEVSETIFAASSGIAVIVILRNVSWA